MATIALYAGKINMMPEMINGINHSIINYQSELSALKAKTLSINRSVCNTDDIISSIETSSKTQELKNASLNEFKQSSEDYITDVVCIDGNVADTVRQRKDDFYEKYNFLKPEYEKSGWEKFKDKCKKIGDWCKEHWVAIVTAVVVVVIAAVALVCGVAVAFIAAIAGIVALVLCIADTICMLVTGGKDIATVLRENGFNVLADIFQGLSFGADLVSIVFPLGAAIKTIAKIGVRTFVEVSIKSIKTAFKEMIEKVFKSGFKNGVKNFFEIGFKTLVVDIDDFTKVKNGKRVLDLWEPVLEMPDANKHWIVEGDKLIPKSDSIPAPGRGGHSNPDGLSMEGIMKKYNLDYISLKQNGDIDWGSISMSDVNIRGMSDRRKTSKGLIGNYNKADEVLKKRNISKAALEQQFKFLLTWHESLNMKTMHLVPTEIHANISHVGGVGSYKFTKGRIAEQIENILQNMFKFSIRKAISEQ